MKILFQMMVVVWLLTLIAIFSWVGMAMLWAIVGR